MAVDKEITDPKELANFIEKHTQPGNQLGYPWIGDFELSDAEWALILKALRQ